MTASTMSPRSLRQILPPGVSTESVSRKIPSFKGGTFSLVPVKKASEEIAVKLSMVVLTSAQDLGSVLLCVAGSGVTVRSLTYPVRSAVTYTEPEVTAVLMSRESWFVIAAFINSEATLNVNTDSDSSPSTPSVIGLPSSSK